MATRKIKRKVALAPVKMILGPEAPTTVDHQRIARKAEYQDTMVGAVPERIKQIR